MPSKYFYDDKGSQIFQHIMRMPEYYLSNCEYEIFSLHKKSIAEKFCDEQCIFDIIELGAGDGLKTRVLIRYLLQNKVQFKYIPIDISANSVQNLSGTMKSEFPQLLIEEKIGDYFEMMEEINRYDQNPKIILFLGSNIGNFTIHESVEFFRQLAAVMNSGDQLFIGFDLKKDPSIIMKAYDDPHGFTQTFNLNLLERLNRELEANFRIENFEHYPVYDPLEAAAKSYIISKTEQAIFIPALDESYYFKKWEAIYTEMSQKYSIELIRKLAEASSFKVEQNFFDSRQYYVNSLWRLTN